MWFFFNYLRKNRSCLKSLLETLLIKSIFVHFKIRKLAYPVWRRGRKILQVPFCETKIWIEITGVIWTERQLSEVKTFVWIIKWLIGMFLMCQMIIKFAVFHYFLCRKIKCQNLVCGYNDEFDRMRQNVINDFYGLAFVRAVNRFSETSTARQNLWDDIDRF